MTNRIKKPRINVHGGMSTTQFHNAYEGASRSYRMRNKGMSNGGPNQDIKQSLSTLRKRSRHAIQNHPLAVSAIENYTSQLIGNGITAKWPDKAIQALWEKWIKECDADGIDSFYGLQVLAARSQFEAGEVLVRRRARLPQDGLSVPLQIQLLESDHLDENYNSQVDNNITMGIQFNGIGQRVFYHLWRNHPSESGTLTGNIRNAVPANDVIHLFRRLRPGQQRGVPELTAVLARLYDIDEMQDSTLMKQKSAALFGWIVTKKSPEIQAGQETNFVDRGLLGADEGEETEEGTPITEIRSGGIHYMEEDEDVKFSSPDGIGQNYIPWLKSELRTVAKGLPGCTYEQLTGDLTDVNYSSIRAGLVEIRRRIEQLQYMMMIHRFCHPIAQWFLDHAVISGAVTIKNYWSNRTEYLPTWFTPRWDWVDPLKDVMADLIETRTGFTTRAAKVAERGGDIEKVDEQLLKEQASELVLDSNPKVTTKAGQLQAELVNELINQESENA
jgi:lambda family phage portal protein